MSNTIYYGCVTYTKNILKIYYEKRSTAIEYTKYTKIFDTARTFEYTLITHNKYLNTQIFN